MAHTDGPESPTLVERFVAVLGLPHAFGCFFLVLVLYVVFTLFANYVQTGSLADAVAQSIASLFQPGALLFGFLLFYVLYVPHHIRERILAAEDFIGPRLPGGEDDFHKLFGRISSVKRQSLVWMGFLALFLPGFLNPSNLPSSLLGLLFVTILSLGFSQVVWTYAYSLRGIHRIGNAPLNLKPYYLDRLLGLRPAASLALSIAIAYFAFVGILVIISLINPPPLSIYLLIFGLIILGVLMFILPLKRLHECMTKQKRLEREKLESKLAQVFETPAGTTPLSYQPSLELTLDAIRLDIMKREIASIATWPFDFQILGKFTIIILSVVAALLARYIGSLLNL